ncbi:SWIM zinc finger family protein [Robertmurraya kyonggiensis]|uniref:SWIM-type domain-containing protein n=1 Tax=Robertmurraya kyonggiensis TaxID=1037680 RepID=A0A4U1D1P2_9BACI|nr:hypothetical protein [Robertmurraya kyonggiensis]TKC16172.1 hypothetical protein FA727_14545 [Robertmurraya kyonggiensis]
MNINNFKSYINKTILDRGHDYFLEGRVEKAIDKGEQEYIFHIEGSDNYEVLVELDEDGDILYSECDCPYDFGPICKHEVAVFFQLKEMLNQVNVKDKNFRKEPKIQEVLKDLPREELIDIILNIVKKDDRLESSLRLKYSKVDHKQELKRAQQLIKEIVKEYKGREGFIKYRDTGDFVREMMDIDEIARTTEDVLLALDISFLLLKEAIDAFQYADDSDGNIGYLVTNTLGAVEEIASRGTGVEHVQIFEKLFAQLDKQYFDGWEDFKFDLLNICIGMATDVKLREQLRFKLESMLKKESDRYMQEQILQLLLGLIEQYGTKEEEDEFISRHLQFTSFRERVLAKYLQEGKYQQVIELADEGEEKDLKYPGLISKWKKFRYEAYKKLQLSDEQKVLGKELFFDGNFEYYQDLKELASREDFYANLKRELKDADGWYSTRMFLRLIEEENDLDEILEFVKNNPSYIEQYEKKLLGQFKEEVIEIYQDYIKAEAATSSNRNQYKEICRKLKKYKVIAGDERLQELVAYFKSLYIKRPAFIDELGKIR